MTVTRTGTTTIYDCRAFVLRLHSATCALTCTGPAGPSCHDCILRSRAVTDCTLADLADLAAGLAAVRRNPNTWSRPPVPLLPTGAQIRAALSRFWLAITALAAPLPAVGPATATAPAHPATVDTDAIRRGSAARRGRTAAGGLGAGSPTQDRNAAAPDGPTESERAALVARARHGDSEAFGLLYDHYAELVFRYALYRLGGDPVAAEDIVSETFLRALRTIGAFRWQGRDIGAWFVTIARNLLIDQARSARRRFEIPTADILTAADERATALVMPGPEESILAVLTRRELLDAVRRLRPDQQECIALRFLEGLSVRETALAMGRNEGAVRALQLRALRALARSLPAAEPA